MKGGCSIKKNNVCFKVGGGGGRACYKALTSGLRGRCHLKYNICIRPLPTVKTSDQGTPQREKKSLHRRCPLIGVSPVERCPLKRGVPWSEVSSVERCPLKRVVPWRKVSPSWGKVSLKKGVPWRKVSPEESVLWREVSPEERCPLKRGFPIYLWLWWLAIMILYTYSVYRKAAWYSGCYGSDHYTPRSLKAWYYVATTGFCYD